MEMKINGHFITVEIQGLFLIVFNCCKHFKWFVYQMRGDVGLIYCWGKSTIFSNEQMKVIERLLKIEQRQSINHRGFSRRLWRESEKSKISLLHKWSHSCKKEISQKLS